MLRHRTRWAPCALAFAVTREEGPVVLPCCPAAGGGGHGRRGSQPASQPAKAGPRRPNGAADTCQQPVNGRPYLLPDPMDPTSVNACAYDQNWRTWCAKELHATSGPPRRGVLTMFRGDLGSLDAAASGGGDGPDPQRGRHASARPSLFQLATHPASTMGRASPVLSTGLPPLADADYAARRVSGFGGHTSSTWLPPEGGEDMGRRSPANFAWQRPMSSAASSKEWWQKSSHRGHQGPAAAARLSSFDSNLAPERLERVKRLWLAQRGRRAAAGAPATHLPPPRQQRASAAAGQQGARTQVVEPLMAATQQWTQLYTINSTGSGLRTRAD
jgi:hypothetical protein